MTKIPQAIKIENAQTDLFEIILYQSEGGKTEISVQLRNETVWLTQKLIASLFETERSVITKHINNIFHTQELERDSVCAKFAHTADDGKTYQTHYYNLDVIIAVGYRVNAKRGTQFRIWATGVLKDHPFSDGNKRIGSFLFLFFIKINGMLVEHSFDNKALVALSLLTAASDPRQKDLMIRLIVNLISEKD
jgi:hypothetical protein